MHALRRVRAGVLEARARASPPLQVNLPPLRAQAAEPAPSRSSSRTHGTRAASTRCQPEPRPSASQ
eukprot:182302-Lingulodinium_polyedra.AAC.1